MAPGLVVASPCCCPTALSTSLSGTMTCHAGPWNSRVAFPITKSSARSRDLLFPDEVSFWGTVLQEQRGAVSEEDVQRRGGRKVVLSATSSQPKPPIFKLKKPLMPVDTTGNAVVAPKTEVFEVGEDGDGRFTVKENHKSGYVALIGNPNVGKSTLLNQIIGQRLSIVTDKPQTTRHRILGICSSPEYQIILYDTPGVLPKTERRLDEKMMQNVTSARMNSDCVLVVVDACRNPEKSMEVLGEGLQLHHERQQPTLIVMNKMDLIRPGEIAKKSEWYQAHCKVDAVIPVSAKFGKGIDRLKAWIVDQLPKGPAYYPKDIVSEHSERFFVSEIVREKIFMQYRKEIPYVSQVNVVQYIERKEPAKDFIEAEIVVERASQMGILIGKDGGALKLLATASRLDIEEFVGKQVYLELKVKVKGLWREDEELLDSYGYNKGKIRT